MDPVKTLAEGCSWDVLLMSTEVASGMKAPVNLPQVQEKEVRLALHLVLLDQRDDRHKMWRWRAVLIAPRADFRRRKQIPCSSDVAQSKHWVGLADGNCSMSNRCH
jgi:hypothetical protein